MAEHWGAAVAGVRVKSTIKTCDSSQIVINTLDRSHLWEMQTPQVINLELLKEGFSLAREKFNSDRRCLPCRINWQAR